MHVEFILDSQPDESLFVFDCDAVPRIGDIVRYEFAPMDKHEWADDSFRHGLDARGFYEVIRVEHLLRVSALRTRIQIVSCYIRKA